MNKQTTQSFWASGASSAILINERNIKEDESTLTAFILHPKKERYQTVELSHQSYLASMYELT